MGTITGLVGRNGAGKTTTLKSILGTIHPDSGEIQIFGKPRSREVMQEVGIVYDECCFSEVLTLRQINSVLNSVYHNWSSDLFYGMCERYGLPGNKKIKTFSRGMKQKLSIAAALAHSPKLLLLDEPTGGLDPVARGEILDDLWEFIEDGQHAVLLSTHITTDLDRIGVILESLSYEGYKSVISAYYDTMLKNKLMRDEDSIEMLDEYIFHF